MALDRTQLENLYKKESDSKVKERLLLVLRVRADGQVPARVVKELHRSNPWASEWLARYDGEGVEGLQNRPKSGRPSKLPAEMDVRIRKRLKESRQGWTTKQAYDIIVKEGGVRYHYQYVYRLLHKWGFKQKVPRKVHINAASEEEKEAFKKRREKS